MKAIFSLSTQGQSLSLRILPVIVMVLALVLPSAAAAQLQGAESCAQCHGSTYQDWVASGHSMILMTGENARYRALPPPSGKTWDEISYVIGGNRTYALYLDDQGYILDDQYNVLTGEWSSAHGSSMVPYDCAACHSTGYESGGNQDGLPGFVGTFELPGVQCEHCHAGSHPAEASTDAAFCGECHNHGAEGTVAAADGFIVSEGQYNEFLVSPHANALDCVSCHNPHETAEFGITLECSNCHSDQAATYTGTLMDMAGIDCNDCHMPPATLSAQSLGPNQGDMKSHVFNINTDPSASMFTPDGSELALTDGEGAVTLDFVCQRCHAGTSMDVLSKFSKEFHNPNVGLEYVGLNPGLSGTWYGVNSPGEGFLIEFAYAGPALYFFGSFYTYDNEGNMVWLTFQPATVVPDTGTTIEVIAYITEGGRFGEGNPDKPVPDRFGTGTFTFGTCTAGSVAINPDQAFLDAGFTNIAYDLTRLLAPGVKCPTFDNTAEVTISAK